MSSGLSLKHIQFLLKIIPPKRLPGRMLLFLAILAFSLALPSCKNAAASGAAEQGFIGASLAPIQSAGTPGKVRISSVAPGYPADMAGLRAGDILLQINGQSMLSTEMVVQTIKNTKVGNTATFTISRSGKSKELVVKMISRATLSKIQSEWKSIEYIRDAPIQSPDGQPVGLFSQLKERNIIFLFATWCPACKASIPALNKIMQTKKAQVIGLSSENIELLKQFTKDYLVSFPLASMKSDISKIEYYASRIPRFYFVDNKGKILNRGTGGQGLSEILQQLK